MQNSGIKRKINTISIIGGCHVTALPKETLTEFPSFDFGIYGEGEKTFLQLLNEISSKRDWKRIKGLIYRDKGEVIVNETQERLSESELDKLPFPAFDQYYGNDKTALCKKGSCYPIFTSRGCPYRCSFCMQVLGRQVRFRSPSNIIREIEYAVEAYGAHTINFSDEVFLSNNQRTKEILHQIINKGLNEKIRFSALTRANMVNKEIVDLAKEAGCYHLEMGVESGDDRILQKVNKRITIPQIEKAVKIIKDAKITLKTYYIIGHPGETKETALKTINLAAKLNTDDIAVGLMVPYPGTKIYELAHKGEDGYRLLSKDWSTYDKYGGQALEIKGLPLSEMEKLQKKAYLKFYTGNLRIIGFFRLIWQKKHAILYLFGRKLSVLNILSK